MVVNPDVDVCKENAKTPRN